MGYTHYWTQTRDFTRDEWVQIREDFEALLKDVRYDGGALAPEISLSSGRIRRNHRKEARDWPRRSAITPVLSNS